MADKRIYDLGNSSSNSRRQYYIQVDKDDLNEAQRLQLGEILKKDLVEGNDGLADDVALTPRAFSATTATTARLGILRTSTDSIAVAGTNTHTALVPSNINPIFEDKLKRTRSYVDSDFDLAASNVSGVDVSNFNEMVTGNFVVITGLLVVTNVSDVVNLEIVLNATKTPLALSQAGVSRFVTPYYYSHGAVITTSSGKLKIIISNNNGNVFGAGTHQLYFSLTYLAG